MTEKTAHQILPADIQEDHDKQCIRDLIENNEIDYVVEFLYNVMVELNQKYETHTDIDRCFEKIKERTENKTDE